MGPETDVECDADFQQGDMESNGMQMSSLCDRKGHELISFLTGKFVTKDGRRVNYETGVRSKHFNVY